MILWCIETFLSGRLPGQLPIYRKLIKTARPSRCNIDNGEKYSERNDMLLL